MHFVLLKAPIEVCGIAPKSATFLADIEFEVFYSNFGTWYYLSVSQLRNLS